MAADPVAADIRLVDLTKRFEDVAAVDEISFEIGRGSFFAMLGPSGCGKTTTLRMIGGFEDPTAGRIELGGRDVSGLPPYKRDVNTVFQSYALFPHLTIFENVAFGLRRQKVRGDELRRRVVEALELVGLAGLERRKPRQLSGGQQQRIALARALVNRPRVLLLDEPLGALDLKLRKEMQLELKRIQHEVGITFVHVTHDQEEAMMVADRVGVMNGGRLIQVAPPAEMYERPNSRWVAGFIGDVNLMEGRVVSSGLGHCVIESVSNGRLMVSHPADVAPGTHVWMALRPEKIGLDTSAPAAGAENSFTGRVSEIGYLGGMSIYKIRLDSGADIKAAVVNRERKPAQPVSVNDRVFLSFKPEAGVLLTL